MYYEDLQVGHVETTAEIPVVPDEMVAYAKANDPFPLHTDADFARQTPAGELTASFGYVVSLFFRALHTLSTNQGAQEGFLGAVGWKVSFRTAVLAGDRLRLRMQVDSKRLTSKGDRGLVVSTCEILNQSDVVRVVIEISSIYLCRPGSGEG